MRLYNTYAQGMFCVAMRFVNDSMEAEDIVQESFIKAFLKINQFSGEVSFGAWLKRIVIHKCLDNLKSKHKRVVQLEDYHLNALDANNLSNDDGWQVEDYVTIEDVKYAIKQLPESVRYVVMLYLIEGYDHAEIAEILNITEVNSRTKLYRGKLKLQEILKKEKNGTAY